MRVLLTGATGFVGAHVARALADGGCDVVALARPGGDRSRLAALCPRFEVLEGDLFQARALASSLRSLKPELCIHLAWCAEPEGSLHSIKNLDYLSGSLDLFRGLAEAGCRRIVMAGSSVEYGRCRSPVPEDGPIKPENLYAASKHALFMSAAQLARKQGWTFAAGRIFNVYGPHEDPSRLVPQIIRDLLSKTPCALTSGEQIKDYLHVEDVAAALWAIARADVQGPFNIGSGSPISVADLARTVGKLVGAQEYLRIGAKAARPGEPEFLCPDTSLIRTRLGWKPRYGLEEGLTGTIDWWKERVR